MLSILPHHTVVFNQGCVFQNYEVGVVTEQCYEHFQCPHLLSTDWAFRLSILKTCVKFHEKMFSVDETLQFVSLAFDYVILSKFLGARCPVISEALVPTPSLCECFFGDLLIHVRCHLSHFVVQFVGQLLESFVHSGYKFRC